MKGRDIFPKLPIFKNNIKKKNHMNSTNTYSDCAPSCPPEGRGSLLSAPSVQAIPPHLCSASLRVVLLPILTPAAAQLDFSNRFINSSAPLFS